MIEQVLDDDNVKKALDYLMSKKNSRGYDGIQTHDLPEYYELNKDQIKSDIMSGRYMPGKVEQFELLDKKKKTRLISNMCAVDKLISQCIYQVIYEVIDPIMFDQSFAYQKNKGVLAAVKQCRQYILDGNEYVVQVDIEHFFDTIDRDILRRILFGALPDQVLVDVMMRLLTSDVIYMHQIKHSSKGILQGCSISPLVSNLYLTDLDAFLADKGIPFVRYADDIKLFSGDAESAIVVMSDTVAFLENQLNLKINNEKSQVSSAMSARYFDYRMVKEPNNTIKLVKQTRSSSTWYQEWTPSALIANDGHYHILEDGILRKNELTVLFENEDHKQYYPVEAIDQINVYANETYATSFFELMNIKNIDVNFFDSYGRYVGSFIGANTVSDGSVLLKQCISYSDEKIRFQYALRMETAAIRNILAVLKYYKKHKSSAKEIGKAIFGINAILHELKSSDSVTKLMALEGQARQHYYNAIPDILENSDFTFSKRERRPPKNPINAMMSFGNVYLYNRITSLIHRTRLDNRISYIHSSEKRKENLCLDMADIYKPLIIDRTIFTLVNKRMIDPKEHFEPAKDNGVYLNKAGRLIMIQQLKTKMSTKLTDDDNVSRSYVSIIRHDLYELIKSLREDDPKHFVPFTSKG